MYKGGGGYILWRASRAAPPQPRLAVSVAGRGGGSTSLIGLQWRGLHAMAEPPDRASLAARTGDGITDDVENCSSESLVWDITRVLCFVLLGMP